MKKLAEEGRIDFYFEYEPIYKHGKTRGNPQSILFKIFDGPRGKVFTLKKRKDQLYSWLISNWQITPEDWEIIGKYNITVEKGSIAIDGTSLTVVNSQKNSFQVAIIPYTYAHTVFHTYKEGSIVNLEFDIVGKYITKIMSQYLNK